jgi:signal transduction histidine kinase
MSKEDQAQIFTKFFRGSNRPAEVAGAGLGLYLVREYARLLGGKVWLESGAAGTVVRVAVPVKRSGER